jgi:predicted dehydrogenase
MQYFFAGSWQVVPVYAAYAGCRRIAVDYTIPISPIEAKDQRVIERSFRKLLAFTLAEGPRRTVRKVRSKGAASRLSSDYHMVVAVGRELDAADGQVADTADRTFLCLGTRHPICAEVMLFSAELSMPLGSLPEKKAVAMAVSRAVVRLGSIDEAAGYNVYSDKPAPAAARRFLETVTSALTVVTESEAVPSRDTFEAVEPPLRYPASGVRRIRDRSASTRNIERGAAVIAAGDYVRTDVIPALRRSGFALRVVADLEPHVAAYTKDRFGFDIAVTDWQRALEVPDADTVVVASFHDSHATIAAEALRQGKNVLLEKPPVVTTEDLNELLKAARAGGFLEIGYNRRYAPFARAARDLLTSAEGPTTITMLVKEVEIPSQHWYRWPKEGTRVTGNLCHWIDLAIFLLGADQSATEVTLSAPGHAEPDEERTFTIVFRDGSAATIVATQRGDSTLGVQEFIDIRRGDLSIQIDDFRRLRATRSGRSIRRSYSWRNKGHLDMYREILRRIRSREPSGYTLRELELSSQLTILATDMVRSGARQAMLSGG